MDFLSFFFVSLVFSFFFFVKSREEKSPEIHSKIHIRIWEPRGQNSHGKDMALKDTKRTHTASTTQLYRTFLRPVAAKSLKSDEKVVVSVFKELKAWLFVSFCGGAPKERRRRRVQKRLSTRVFLESPFLLFPP